MMGDAKVTFGKQDFLLFFVFLFFNFLNGDDV